VGLNYRKVLLGVALANSCAASLYLFITDESTGDIGIELVSQPQVTIVEKHNTTEIKLEGRFLQGTSKDIFLVSKPAIETSKPVVTEVHVSSPIVPLQVALPPPPPSVPPLPFTYIGKYIEDGELVVFLAYQGKNLIVKAGDQIQQNYKIDEIKPPLLTMTYLPIGVQQTIQIGELK